MLPADTLFMVLFCYLCNDVSILSMHLCNGAKVSDYTEHLIDLKRKRYKRVSARSLSSNAKTSNSLKKHML